jgi:catechol 2,3-dioxygenase-like lactoylglutathione lyase family enzyme
MTTAEGPGLLTRVEFFVSDLDRAIDFYTRLGFVLVRRWEGWALVDRSGSRIGLQEDAYARGHPHSFPPHLDRVPRGVGVEVSVDVADEDDLRRLYDTAQAMGCVVREWVVRGWGATDFRIADPDGYFVRFTTPLGPLGE